MLGPSHPDTKVRCTVMMIRPCRPYGILIPYCIPYLRIYCTTTGGRREASSGCSTLMFDQLAQ